MPQTLPTPPRATSLGRVLIVDDNADLAGALRDVLLGAGTGPAAYVVRTATCGREALAMARDEGFDVAIVDVKLPDASGVDLIIPLRALSVEGEVVLITGFASMDAAIAALRSGAFALIVKSFRPEELIATVEQAITKVRLTRERAELERRYRAVVELTDVLVVALDASGGVVLFNRKAASMAGVASEEARGHDFVSRWVSREDGQRLTDALAAALAGDKAREVETSFGDRLAERGAMHRVRWHLSRVRDGFAHSEGGGLVYGIGIDTTERRALEKRAADAEALSAMGELAMGLAHEIRNPLNAANLQLHLLNRAVDRLAELSPGTRSEMHKRLHIVGDEIGRLGRLLTEFLELARPRELSRQAVELGELVEAVLALEREQAEARGVKIAVEIDSDGPRAIGDAEKLKQVVLNLVVNALEAMKDGGSLSAKVFSRENKVVLQLDDTGPGIDPSVLAQVFDPFFTTKEAGTGLGLSIVRKIIDQHGGDVRIDSARGKGASVIVSLPAARSAPEGGGAGA